MQGNTQNCSEETNTQYINTINYNNNMPNIMHEKQRVPADHIHCINFCNGNNKLYLQFKNLI